MINEKEFALKKLSYLLGEKQLQSFPEIEEAKANFDAKLKALMKEKMSDFPRKDEEIKLTSDDRDELIYSLIVALHATIYGVYSMKDPEHSHEALSDQGEIHVLVHQLVKLLPPKGTKK